MAIKFPYELTEGTIAYARHVMANLRAIVRGVDNLGETSVKKNASGNANEIVFDDDETLQDKLDNGGFNTWDGSLYDGYASFTVNNQGHLIAALTVDDPDMYQIDENGHLILTAGDTEGGTVHTFDLGDVRGPQGEQGENGPSSTTYRETLYAADWSNVTQQITVYCDGVTANNNFMVQPDYPAIVAAHEADPEDTPDLDDIANDWSLASPVLISQAAGSFVLQARGVNPSYDIPVVIVCDI